MRHCSGCFGVDVGNFRLTDINYADDAVLFTDDPTKWDYVFRNSEAPAGVMGLHTNWHKTKIQNIGTGDAPRTVHTDNQAVETVSRFTYLGSSVEEIHSVGTINNVETSYFTQLKICYQMTTLRCPSSLRY